MCKGRQFRLVDAFEDSFVRAASMIGGDDYAKVARSLARSEDPTDRDLSNSTDIGLNKVRRVLYDLWRRCLIKVSESGIIRWDALSTSGEPEETRRC